MFISRQRNFILNISEFIQRQNVNNLFDVNISNDFNTFDESRFKIIKSLMFNDNWIKFKN